MGIELPDLDDRTFEELVTDARKRIPVYSETWTDHNVHDPGITFLELFAWIAETDIYRLDQITDAHVKEYLQLVGVHPRPPQPATVRLQLDIPSERDGWTVDAGQLLGGHVGPETVELFRTQRAITVTTASVDAVVSQHRDGQTNNTTANDTVGMYYRAFGDEPAAGDTLYLGFGDDPFANADRLDLIFDFYEANLPPQASHGDEESDFEPSHRIVWEFYEGEPGDTSYEQWYDDDRWSEFEVIQDGTIQFYEGGTVSLAAADEWAGEKGTILGIDREGYCLYWIRCRLARLEPEPSESICDSPETPTDPPVPHYEVPPQFSAIRTNVVTAEHCASETNEYLERHDGSKTTAWPDQTFHFDHTPIQSATITVGGTGWTEVPSFAGSDPDDEHYVLDQAEGIIRFGDGIQGEVPPAGQHVIAPSYVYGGGTAGNVPPSTEWTFGSDAFADVDVASMSAASGGTDAESIESAIVRAKEDQQTPYRAITRSDYRYLATHTPGLRFGRAAVLIGDDSESNDSPGTVRVVVVPFSPPDIRPIPSEGFLDAVDCHLKRHALLSDEVTAVAPTYVGVDIEAEVRVAEGTVWEERRRAAERAIDDYLDPLQGFEGDGWPFGRPIYLSEMYEVLETTDGIESVIDVSVTTSGGVDLAANESALPSPESIDVRIVDEPDDYGWDD